jgi:alkylation response protein AidB-like acyl-CoA dehydrogenase
MSVSFTDDQEELRRYVRQWLDERAPLDEVRRIMESEPGYDAGPWKELGDLGWLGMAISTERGGAGYGFGELAVMGEEMGRTLYPSPFLPTVVMAAPLIAALGTEEQQSELLAAIADGSMTASVALVDAEPGASAVASPTEAGGNAAWSLTGVKSYVINGATADRLLVVAETPAGREVFLVEPGTSGVGVDRLDVMDLTRPQAIVRFDSAPATRLGDGSSDVAAALDDAAYRAVAFLSMEQVGGAQACLDMSVAYAKSRYQFGRPIGSFQAIKHMCADMLVAVESAKSAAYHLAGVIGADPEEVAIAAPLAKSFCSEAYFRCAADTIQIHGGIGFTWEHDAHLYLKRAKSSELMFGGPAEHRRRLAGGLGIT